jgi:hypothetical protein
MSQRRKVKVVWSVFTFLFLFLQIKGSFEASLGRLKIRLQDQDGRILDGKIKITSKKGSKSYSCTTKNGVCIQRLSAGIYIIKVHPHRGNPPPSRTIVVRQGRISYTTFKIKVARRSGPKVKISKPLLKGKGIALIKKISGRNLGKGKRITMRGRTIDARGRILDGIITVKKNRKIIGKVYTKNGRYRIYDLSPGRYELLFVSTRDHKVKTFVMIKKNRVSYRIIRAR